MPKISCKKALVNKAFNKQMTIEQLEDLGFDYGIEIEEDNEEDKYVFELGANRPDQLSAEHLLYTLRVYLQLEPIRHYTFLPPKEKIIVKNSTKQIRPYIVGAILRDVTLDQAAYESFIDFQDKLHQNYCRKRKLVAIGTHNLDSIKGPFIYDAKNPKDIVFKALKQQEEMDCNQLFQKLESDVYLKPYLSIIRDSEVYPVIYDSNNVVLSLPPIINGDHSKMSAETKNIFIESTATDEQRALNTLACLVCSISEYCQSKFTVEMVEVVYEDSVKVTPAQQSRELKTDIGYINDILGIDITAEQGVQLLKRMGVESKPNGNEIIVDVPLYRIDILQQCDIAEDIGIAYGYNNIEKKRPQSVTIGKEYQLNKLGDMIREECAICGFVECLNFVLCSQYETVGMLNQKESNQVVFLGNSKSAEFECARSQLLGGILKTLKTNARSKLPLQLFEVADVVIKGDKIYNYQEGEGQVGAKNERRLCAIVSDTNSSGLDIIHGLLDQIMMKLKVENKRQIGYHIEQNNSNKYAIIQCDLDSTFFEGLQAKILYKEKQIGVMGVLHPKVLSNIDWHFPAAAIELNIEPLVYDFQ